MKVNYSLSRGWVINLIWEVARNHNQPMGVRIECKLSKLLPPEFLEAQTGEDSKWLILLHSLHS